MTPLSRAVMIATEARQRARDNPFPIFSEWGVAFEYLLRYPRVPPRRLHCLRRHVAALKRLEG